MDVGDLAGEEEEGGEANGEEIVEQSVPDQSDQGGAVVSVVGVDCYHDQEGNERDEEDGEEEELVAEEEGVGVVVDELGRTEEVGGEWEHVFGEEEEDGSAGGEEGLEDGRVLDVEEEGDCHELHVVQYLHEPAGLVAHVDDYKYC